MNLDQYNFNVPAFVREAGPDSFDTNADGAVVVGGLRIDNRAAAWVAGASLRKSAGMDLSVSRIIKEACDLFGVSDADYVENECIDVVTVSDGVHNASFNIYDNASLNKAASDLVSRRPGLPYPFAHDCAATLMDEAHKQGLQFDRDVVVAIRKMAGDYNVDFEAGKQCLISAIDVAKNHGMQDHAEVLTKIASLCTPDCSPSAAPYFIAAIDEFYRGLRELRKSASAIRQNPEDIFYLSTEEYNNKLNNLSVKIDSNNSVKVAKINSAKNNISKWASVCGYSIPANASVEQIATTVSSMPSTIRKEFMELFA